MTDKLDADRLYYVKRKMAKQGAEIGRLKAEIKRLKEVIRTARDTAYSSSQDCPRCGFIDDLLTKALNESEGK